MLRQFRQIIPLFIIISMTSSIVSADGYTGRFESLDLNKGRIVVGGKEYAANMETTRISYNGEVIGEEGLVAGDKVTLIFSESKTPGGVKRLTHIVLQGSRKPGADS